MIQITSLWTKNALLEFMDLCFQVYGPKWQITSDGPKNALFGFIDLNVTPLQVGGRLVHFTLYFILLFPSSVLAILSFLLVPFGCLVFMPAYFFRHFNK